MALLTIVRRTASLWWRNWPWLVAIYLVGWLLRYWVLHAAVAVGLAHGVLWGTFVVVLAPIVRLLSYLAMFLVIRSSTEELQHVRVDTERRGVFDTVTSAILPFLVIYTVWQLIAEDYSAFLSRSITPRSSRCRCSASTRSLSMASGLRLWIVVVVAFTVRWLITQAAREAAEVDLDAGRVLRRAVAFRGDSGFGRGAVREPAVALGAAGRGVADRYP